MATVAEERVIQFPTRTKRKFAPEWKVALVEQTTAPGANVTALAKEHGLQPAQLFSWRKAARKGTLTDRNTLQPDSPADWYKQALARLDRLQIEIGAVVMEKFLSDLKADKITSYNASIAYSSLVTSASKMESLRLEIMDKLSALPPEPVAPEAEQTNMTAEQKREVGKFAEKLLAELYRQKQATQVLKGEVTNV